MGSLPYFFYLLLSLYEIGCTASLNIWKNSLVKPRITFMEKYLIMYHITMPLIVTLEITKVYIKLVCLPFLHKARTLDYLNSIYSHPIFCPFVVIYFIDTHILNLSRQYYCVKINSQNLFKYSPIFFLSSALEFLTLLCFYLEPFSYCLKNSS